MWYYSYYVNESDVFVWQTGSNDKAFERENAEHSTEISKIEMLASEAFQTLSLNFNISHMCD